MWAKLLLVTAAFVIPSCVNVNAASSKTMVINTEQDASSLVFVGADAKMPVGESKTIAINPRTDVTGQLVMPTSLASAFKLMRDALPNWYVNALLRTSGNTDCDVLINGLSVSSALTIWFLKNFDMTKKSSQISIELRQFGLPDDYELVRSAIQSGFCEFVRTDNAVSSLSIVKQYSRDEPLFKRKAWE
jgi:hypothetical protein